MTEPATQPTDPKTASIFDVLLRGAKGAVGWVSDGHEKLIVYTLVAFALVFMWNANKDLRAEIANQKATTGTLAVEFGKLGEAYTGQGRMIQSSNDALSQAIAAQGAQLTATMAQQGNHVMALFAAHGKIIAELVANQGTTTGVTPGTNGAFTGANLVQGRLKGPALTDVTVNYDPTNTNPTMRLTGTWANYREEFSPTVIGWQKNEDKSMTGTFRLTRTVYKADGTKVGEEEIPLDTATSTFSPSLIPGPEVSRWSAAGGPVWDSTTRTWNPGIGVHYQITKQLGIMPGIAGKNLFLWGSYTFGK